MSNKPCIVLFLSILLLVEDIVDFVNVFFCFSNEIFVVLDRDLFPCIPNSSVDSRSNESTVSSWLLDCWPVGKHDGDTLFQINELWKLIF